MHQQGYEQNYGQVGGGYAGGAQQGHQQGYASMVYNPAMGGPPPQGYPPQSFQGAPMMAPQSFVAQQAQAELEALEARKKEKEETRKEREARHMTHALRSGARNNGDNQSCAKTLCMWKVFNGLMYGVALLGDSWTVNQWEAMGIDSMTLSIGLFNMDIDLRCKESVDMKFCNMMKKWADHDDGQWSIKDLQKHMCDEDKDTCWTMGRLYVAGWIPLVLFPLAAAFECSSLILLYLYWHAKPISTMRSMSDKCAVLAVCCAGVGFCCWLGIRPWISGLPRAWATMGGQRDAAAGVFLGFKELWCMPVGWCFICAWTGALGTFVSMFVQLSLPRHVDEPDPYGFDEQSALIEDHVRKETEKYYGTDA